jgi:2-methylcitrate dehydratase PrpD
MSILGDLASFVCRASVASLPEAERAIQRRHVADTLVAAFAGIRTAEGRALRSLLTRDTVPEIIGMQSAIIRHTEIDDIHTASCTTPSSVTVPTALGLARAQGQFDPERVASAIWVGTELMTRLGTAIDGARILYRGIWPTYFTAPLASAAVTARMRSMGAEETAHALSLALMLAGGRSARFAGRVPGRSVILGMAVGNGVRAAEAAHHGVGGDPDLLDGRWLAEAHRIEANLAAMSAQLGKQSVYREMSLKPFCSAKQALAAVEALTTMLDEGEVKASEITRVTVRVPPPYARMVATRPEASSRSSTIISAGYQLGLAAFAREQLYDIDRARLASSATEFAGRTEVIADESLMETFPRCFPAEVEVMAAGRSHRLRITAASGDPSRNLDDEQLAKKAERICQQVNCARRASDLIRIGLQAFESEKSCKAVADAMSSAFTFRAK